jgi:hypothetical protein
LLIVGATRNRGVAVGMTCLRRHSVARMCLCAALGALPAGRGGGLSMPPGSLWPACTPVTCPALQHSAGHPPRQWKRELRGRLAPPGRCVATRGRDRYRGGGMCCASADAVSRSSVRRWDVSRLGEVAGGSAGPLSRCCGGGTRSRLRPQLLVGRRDGGAMQAPIYAPAQRRALLHDAVVSPGWET